jgi:hypothetical protein
VNKVKLDDVMEALELADDEGNYYYNKSNSKVIYIGQEERGIAEECDVDELEDYPEWQRDAIEAAIDVEENWDNYVALPTKLDINEYDIMVGFSQSIENDRISNQLMDALNGRGAYRRFKDTVIRLNIEKKWYDFRDEVLKNIAIEWCRDNNINLEKS